jgi:hypothetical protein
MTRSSSRRKKSEKKCGIPPRKSLRTVIRRCALYVKNGLYFQKKEGSPVKKEKEITYCLPEHVSCPYVEAIKRLRYLSVTYGSTSQMISRWFLTIKTRARRRSNPFGFSIEKMTLRNTPSHLFVSRINTLTPTPHNHTTSIFDATSS